MTSITNAERVLFPASGVTKGELVMHYELVADRLLPHVAGRPLTLERYPRGIDGAVRLRHAGSFSV